MLLGKCSWAGKSQLLIHVRGIPPAHWRKKRDQRSGCMGYPWAANHMRDEKNKRTGRQRHWYSKRSGLGLWYCPGLMIFSLNPCMQGRSKGELWLFVCPLLQRRAPLESCASWSRWMFLARVGIRVGAKTASYCSIEFWAKTTLPIQTLRWFPLLLRAGCWHPSGKRQGIHRMLSRGNNVTFTSALQKVALATAASFEGPCLSTAARWLQNRTLLQTDSDAVANPQAKRIC